MATGIPEHLTIHAEPVADPAAVVAAGNVRVTVLTRHLLRIEYDPSAAFEDRPSQAIWFRRQETPEFSAKAEGNCLKVQTGALELACADTTIPFCADTLAVTLKDTGAVWHFGDVDHENLRGPVRTLDNKDGAVPLDPGLVSRSGWSVVDDSRSLVFDSSSWLEARTPAEGRSDLYFFGHGPRYQEVLRDFVRIAGPIPLVPRWCLGNWWSRYWAYTDREVLDLMREFHQRGIPLSVCVLDMDWHVVKNEYHRGWTGYSWSREHFPDPDGFLAQMRELGLKVSLNLHPHDGVHPHEDAYEAVARAVARDLRNNRRDPGVRASRGDRADGGRGLARRDREPGPSSRARLPGGRQFVRAVGGRR